MPIFWQAVNVLQAASMTNRIISDAAACLNTSMHIGTFHLLPLCLLHACILVPVHRNSNCVVLTSLSPGGAGGWGQETGPVKSESLIEGVTVVSPPRLSQPPRSTLGKYSNRHHGGESALCDHVFFGICMVEWKEFYPFWSVFIVSRAPLMKLWGECFLDSVLSVVYVCPSLTLMSFV